MNSLINLNIYNLIIAVGAIQGFLFSIVVFLNPKYKSNSNFYLSLLIAVISLNNLYYWFIDINYIKNIEIYKLFYIPWALLIVPMYYYFVNSYLHRNRIKLNFFDYIFYPFYIFYGFHLGISIYKYFFYLEKDIYLNLIEKLYFLEEYFSALFTLFIIYKIYRKIRLYDNNNLIYNKKKIVKGTKWLKHILLFGVLICAIWVVMILYNNINSLALFSNENRYFLWISNSILIYYLGYLGIYHNGIFKQREKIREIIGLDKKTNNSNKLNEIKNIIEKEKLFLNPNLSLRILSDRFKLNESYFSHYFNQNSDQNFSNYINKLRIENVKEILINDSFKNYTLVSIALESGFNSKSAFYSSFKKETGLTPTEYRKQNLS